MPEKPQAPARKRALPESATEWDTLFHVVKMRYGMKPSAFFEYMNYYEADLFPILSKYGLWRCPNTKEELLKQFDATIGVWYQERLKNRAEQNVHRELPDGSLYTGPADGYDDAVIEKKWQRWNRTLDNIRGGAAGTLGYLALGDAGSDAGALVDQMAGAVFTNRPRRPAPEPYKPTPAYIAPDTRGTANRGVTMPPGVTVRPNRAAKPKPAKEPEAPAGRGFVTIPDPYLQERRKPAPAETPRKPVGQGKPGTPGTPSEPVAALPTRPAAPPEETLPQPKASTPPTANSGPPQVTPVPKAPAAAAKPAKPPRGQGHAPDEHVRRSREYVASKKGRLEDADDSLATAFQRTGKDKPNIMHLRSSANEIALIEHLLSADFRGPVVRKADGSVVRLTVQKVVAHKAAQGTRTPDFSIVYSDGSRILIEATSVTSAPARGKEAKATGKNLFGPTMEREPTLTMVEGRLVDKGVDTTAKRSQLASPPRGQTAGGMLEIGIMFPSANNEALCRQAMNNKASTLSAVTQSVMFLFRIAPQRGQQERKVIIFDRQPNGSYVERN
ncbi:hypothetical protein Rhe02_60120 [Rhizocola hellebori]|uniref:Uncharacterized protein n=1 Tax=Rhizocola hellebori TaxID=1392758 RepID=A0A8J3VIU3_9ACTN|nr:hypothetical protein [Rhizocola hellebori]GIH07945.1 hypothetical protein Rhe02_60120 [Rhizocola hellebori]